MRARIVPALAVLLASMSVPVRAQAPLPSGWPARLELGLADSPGGAAAMKATAPFSFRYQYLAGGVNTGGGWATWNTNGDFARFYIQDSVANGIIPVFTYYMLLQSSPAGGSESNAVFTNLNNTATMTAYYNDLKLFFQKAGAFPGTMVVLHVEPDFWGYMEQRASGDNAATVPAKVSETGIAALAGLPSNVSGFARAVVRLRDTYAPNVVLGYHVSVWGTGTDIALQDPADSMVDTLAARAGAFYNSLGANFDIAFGGVQRSGFRLLSVRVRRQRQFLVERRGFPPRRPLPQRILHRGVKTHRDVADSHGQHEDARAEQHDRPLPGQPSGMAARRPFARAPRVVHRRRSRGVPLRRRSWRREHAPATRRTTA